VPSESTTRMRPPNIGRPHESTAAASATGLVLAAWHRDQGDADPGQKLRDWVWDKLQPRFPEAKVVLLSPDGATAMFPWAALPGKQPGTFLIDETALATIPIPQLVPELLNFAGHRGPSKAADEKPSLLVVGDVDFGGDPGADEQIAMNRGAARGNSELYWPALPGTRQEVAAVQEAFSRRFEYGRVRALSKSDATKSAVRHEATNYQYLHFSTHGFFAPPQVRSALVHDPSAARRLGLASFASAGRDVTGFHPGLLSGLVLTGANLAPAEGKDDGILTALEVENLDLRNVQLATLSACETGLGATAGGEGLLGLQRSFQLGGAKTVVASLWKVPDKATEVLMSRFYENLWEKKMSKIEALREAQRWLLHEGPKQPGLLRGLELPSSAEEPASPTAGLSPRYWAAFVLSGDWR